MLIGTIHNLQCWFDSRGSSWFSGNDASVVLHSEVWRLDTYDVYMQRFKTVSKGLIQRLKETNAADVLNQVNKEAKNLLWL